MREKIRIQLIKVGETAKIYWFKVPQRFRKILKITGITFVLLVILMSVLSFGMSLKKSRSVVKKIIPTIIPLASPPAEVITNPSKYATDSAVLKIEADLRAIEGQIDNLRVNEVNLLPPRLDFAVSFEN